MQRICRREGSCFRITLFLIEHGYCLSLLTPSLSESLESPLSPGEEVSSHAEFTVDTLKKGCTQIFLSYRMKRKWRHPSAYSWILHSQGLLNQGTKREDCHSLAQTHPLRNGLSPSSPQVFLKFIPAQETMSCTSEVMRCSTLSRYVVSRQNNLARHFRKWSC